MLQGRTEPSQERTHADYYETASLQRASFVLAKHPDAELRIGGDARRAIFYLKDPDGQIAWDGNVVFDTDEPVPVLSLFSAMNKIKNGMDSVFGKRSRNG